MIGYTFKIVILKIEKLILPDFVKEPSLQIWLAEPKNGCQKWLVEKNGSQFLLMEQKLAFQIG